MRDLIKELLETSYPAVVLEATDGDEARELLKTAVFDLVIADIHMPQCDGVELYAWVAKHIPALCEHFIFLTGAGKEQAVQHRLAKLPPVRILHKPLFVNELMEVVQEILRENTPSVPWPESH